MKISHFLPVTGGKASDRSTDGYCDEGLGRGELSVDPS